MAEQKWHYQSHDHGGHEHESHDYGESFHESHEDKHYHESFDMDSDPGESATFPKQQTTTFHAFTFQGQQPYMMHEMPKKPHKHKHKHKKHKMYDPGYAMPAHAPKQGCPPVMCDPHYVVRDCYVPREVQYIHPIVQINRHVIVNVPKHVYQPITKNVVVDPGCPCPPYHPHGHR